VEKQYLDYSGAPSLTKLRASQLQCCQYVSFVCMGRFTYCNFYQVCYASLHCIYNCSHWIWM